MADPASIGRRHHQALTEVAEILERHDPEIGERIRKANHGRGIPSPKKTLETAAYHAECMLSLAQLIDERLTPKKRGRPPKVAQGRSSS
jgi:hypothetical protein